jgi:hypothetical protein
VTACGDVVTIGMIPALNDNSIVFTAEVSMEVLVLHLGTGDALVGQQQVIESQLIPADGAGCGSLDVTCTVTDPNGNTTAISYGPARVTMVPYGLFRRIDANSDALSNIGDAIFLLGYLFNNSDAPGCEDAADVSDDGGIDIGDAIYLLASLFTNGPPPPLPGFTCGPDTTADTLRCEDPQPCSTAVTVENLEVSFGIDDPVTLNCSWQETGPVNHVQVVIDGVVVARLAAGIESVALTDFPALLNEVCIRLIGEESVAEACSVTP